MSSLLIATDRQPFEWVEYDQPLCAEVYGIGACTATIGVTGSQKCFNTRATCQDPTNYNGTDTLTLRFCHNQGKIPDDNYYLPYLQTATLSPGKINIGGGNKNQTALGVRSGLSVSLSDHPHNDKFVDPYRLEREYDPFTRGTFWTKWRARNPYYLGRIMRHYSGLFIPNTNQIDPDTLISRTFFVTGASGSGQGGMRLTAKDLMSLAFNDKAKAPAVSEGKLSAALTDVATSFTLTPAGIGDADYPASGEGLIADEMMTFTRVADVFTVTRGTRTTSATSHDEGDLFQLSKVIIAQSPSDILYDFLVNHAGIDASYLDKVQWDAEQTDYLPRLYTAIIAKPTGITELVSEMCEQMYFTTYWDERVALQKLKAMRPAQGDEITLLNDEANLLVNSIQWKDLQEELITQVWINYAQRDPTKKINEPSNYAAVSVTVAPEAQGTDKYNTTKITQIYSRWISSTAAVAADDLGVRLLTRYGSVNRQVKFDLDAKDRDLFLADFVQLTNRNVVDQYGNSLPVNLQIISAQETVQASKYQFVANEYDGSEIQAQPDEFLIRLDVDAYNINFRDIFDSQYGTPMPGDKVRFVLSNKANIYGTAVFTGTLGQKIPVTTYSGEIAFYIGQGGWSTVDFLPRTLPYVTRQDPATASVDYSVTKNGNNQLNSARYKDPVTGVDTDYILGGDIRERAVIPSFDTGTWPAGVELFLDIEAGARIIGQAGSGATGWMRRHDLDLKRTEPTRFLTSPNGGDGGDAIRVQHEITINNKGLIAGGGGGGGAWCDSPYVGAFTYFVFGGGGAGNAIGRRTGNMFVLQASRLGYTRTASYGGTLNAGVGGIQDLLGIDSYLGWRWFGRGGKGGALGSAGLDGTAEYINNSPTGTTYSNKDVYGRGGLAGRAISEGADLVTWVNQGDTRGDLLI